MPAGMAGRAQDGADRIGDNAENGAEPARPGFRGLRQNAKAQKQDENKGFPEHRSLQPCGKAWHHESSTP
jgi:hypothetical protein